MPFESDKQRGAMYAAAEGKGNLGIPEKVADKFIKDSGDPVPKNGAADRKVAALRKSGRISDRQAERKGLAPKLEEATGL